MEMPELHRRVLTVSVDIGDSYGLVLVGGYGLRAHGLVDRPSQDLDFAVCSSAPLSQTVEAIAVAYRAAGFHVVTDRGTALMARLIVSDPITGQSCVVDLLKKPLQRPPVTMEVGPVADLDDMVGMKVAALHGRHVTRDLIDVAAVGDRYSFRELERLGRLFDEDFDLAELVDHLELALSIDETQFAEYGLSPAAIRHVRRFHLDWYDDLSTRLAADTYFPAE